jgi:hypothetical protein
MLFFVQAGRFFSYRRDAFFRTGGTPIPREENIQFVFLANKVAVTAIEFIHIGLSQLPLHLYIF